MDELSLLPSSLWYPLSSLGYTHPLFTLNSETIIHTWAVLGICTLLALIGRYCLTSGSARLRYGAISCIRFFDGMLIEAAGRPHERLTLFIASLFTFILLCNLIVLLPGGEEPTKDLNTTFALAFISFFTIQATLIAHHGIVNYLREYIKTPFSLSIPTTLSGLLLLPIKLVLNTIAGAISLPFEILSKFSLVISLSFRLFGNIFGGAIIATLFKHAISYSFITQILGVGPGLILALFFGLFEGGVQAFIFTILTATYLGIALTPTEEAHVN